MDLQGSPLQESQDSHFKFGFNEDTAWHAIGTDNHQDGGLARRSISLILPSILGP